MSLVMEGLKQLMDLQLLSGFGSLFFVSYFSHIEVAFLSPRWLYDLVELLSY